MVYLLKQFNEKNENKFVQNKKHVNYIPINALVTSVKNKKYKFNIFNNQECSSSIYEPNDKNWRWNVKKIEEIELISTTIEDIIKEYKWEDKKYDCIIDVQGAEMEVLKGFSKKV